MSKIEIEFAKYTHTYTKKRKIAYKKRFKDIRKKTLYMVPSTQVNIPHNASSQCQAKQTPNSNNQTNKEKPN